MKPIKSRLIQSFLLIALVSCSASSDSDPGVCSLQCSEPTFASAEFKFTIATQPASLDCPISQGYSSGVLAPNVPVTVRYQIFGEKNGKKFPKANVAFNPIIGGYFDPTKTNEENTGDQYRGIATPMSQWCSDACGVASIQVYPLCMQAIDNNMTVTLQSGFLFSETSKFSFQKPKEEEEEAPATP